MSNEYQQNQPDQSQQNQYGNTDQSGMPQQDQYGNPQQNQQQDQYGNPQQNQQQDQYGNPQQNQQQDQSGMPQQNQQQDQSGQDQQQNAGPFGDARRMADQQVDQGIDNLAGKVPGGDRFAGQAKDMASKGMDSLQSEAEKRGKDMLGGMGGGGDQGRE